MLLIFEDLWWKFFGVLELEFNEISMGQSLKFLEALKLDLSNLWDL